MWSLQPDYFHFEILLITQQAGIITMKASIIKGGVEKFALKQPIFLVSPSAMIRHSSFDKAVMV